MKKKKSGKPLFLRIAAIALQIGVVALSAIGCSPSTAGPPPDGPPPLPDKYPESEEITLSSSKTIRSLSATDALGRTVTPISSFSETRQVGMFYFLWTGQHGSTGASDGHTLDISKTDITEHKANANIGKHHYWDEPLYGYYRSDDAWVFRKHLELLTLAGVDYLVFDYTNSGMSGGETKPHNFYSDVTDELFPVAAEMKSQGWNIPKFVFMLNHNSDKTVEYLYNYYYTKEEYQDLWYRAKDGLSLDQNTEGKPWVICGDVTYLKDEIKEKFYIKRTQWPNEAPSTDGVWDFKYKDDGFPWMSWERVKNGARKQYSHNGIMSVSIAQHVSGAFSDAVLIDNNYNAVYGRGFSSLDNNGFGGNNASRVASGSNFQEQWDYAMAEAKSGNVNNIFVTGWNEWVAQKQPAGNGRKTSYFVDLYDDEFSRDAEMSAGPLGDNYYLQLIENIRKFKGLPASSKSLKMEQKSIDLQSSFAQWDGVAGFEDFAGDTAHRRHASSNSSLPEYLNTTGRNDIVNTRVVYDENNITILITCAQDVTAYETGDKTWMNILIETEGGGEKWNGYSYVVNRTVNGDKSEIERLGADGEGVASCGQAALRKDGKYLAVQIPRAALGLSKDGFAFKFKISDHVVDYTNILSYYVDGDAAPIGRFNYTVRG